MQLIPAENYDTQVFADYDACVIASKDAITNSTGYVFREICASPDQSVVFTAIYMSSDADAIAIMSTWYTQDFVNKRTAFGNCISATFETRMATNFMEITFEKINEAFDSGTVVAVA
mgnify:CR=1 FL=1